MRGIAGIIHFDASPVNRQQIDLPVAAMAICGPDRVSIWHEGPAALGHLVRYNVPEDLFEQQPIVGPGARFVLVADALLSNRPELAADFGWSPAEAAAKADSAFVAAAYAKWGDECLDHLEGQFAFAAWHPLERRLFSAVDAMGLRPFYYWKQPTGIAFASTLKGLLALPGIPREIDPAMFADGFVGFAPVSDRTLYRAISRLPRAHRLRADAGHFRAVRYWEPRPAAPLRLRSDGEYAEAFRAELTRAIRAGLRSNGSAGILLSGGLDSSALTVFAARILAEQGRPLHAFHQLASAPPPVTAELRVHDESRYVRELQRHAPGIVFHYHEYAPQPLHSETALQRCFDDDPVPGRGVPAPADPAWSELLGECGIRTLLNGGGGNGLISVESRPSGYLGYLAATGQWWTLWRECRGLHRFYGTPWRTLGRETAEEAGWRKEPKFEPTLAMTLLHPELLASTKLIERIQDRQAQYPARVRQDFRTALAWSFSESLTQNRGVTRSTISRDLAYRPESPMLDRRLNDFCLQLPTSQQLRAGTDRRLLRAVTVNMLPESIRLRRTRGLPLPLEPAEFERNRAAIRQRLEALLNTAGFCTYFCAPVVTELIQRTTRTPGLRRAEHAVANLMLWGEFLSWRMCQT